jgi:hypothetical protein
MARANLFPDFKEFLKSLISARVKYLLLGRFSAAVKQQHRWATHHFNARRDGRKPDWALGFTPEASRDIHLYSEKECASLGRSTPDSRPGLQSAVLRDV